MSNSYMYVNRIILLALKTVRAQASNQDQSPEFQQDALAILNELLGEMSGTGAKIPFQTKITFNLTAGKGSYSVGTLAGADVETTPFSIVQDVNILLSGIRYPIEIKTDLEYFNTVIYTQNRARPQWVRITREEDISIFEFLPLPDQDYVCELRGKLELPLVDFQGYINLPNWALGYIRLSLAKRLNNFFGYGAWDEEAESELRKAEGVMYAAAKKDMSIVSRSPITRGLNQTAWNIGVISP